MTKALVVALALACAFEARAQEVNGWHRRPPLLQQWQADYDACHAAHTTEMR